MPTCSERVRGLAGTHFHLTSREASRLADRDGLLTAKMWVRRGIVHLSVCVSGGKLYSRPASVPNQWLSAFTARRGRGAKEKAPGKEQSRSGPMPEQEEGADGVSAAGKQGSWPGRAVGLCTPGLGDIMKACGVSVCLLASAQAASTPLLFPASCLMPHTEPRQPRAACSNSCPLGPLQGQRRWEEPSSSP